MGAPKSGNLFLLKAGNGASPEVFTTVAALRATSYAINGEQVDVSNKDGSTWRELLTGGGLKTLSISADGVFQSTETTQTDLRARAMDGALGNYQLDDGDEVIECAFQVASFEADGPLNDAVTFSISLESSGQPTVT